MFVMILTGCSFRGGNPVAIEIWHDFDGSQKIAFDELMTDFNETEGLNKGIIVEGFNKGNLNDLEARLLNTLNEKVGYDEAPDIFSTHSDFVFEIDKAGYVVDLETYMKKGEIKDFTELYIEDGYIGQGSKLKMLPIGKATEILMINKTDWDKFEKATGTRLKELETWEGLAEVAEKYYHWTDKLTKEPDDGKSFFSRSDMNDYVLVGSGQLGEKMFYINGTTAEIEVDNQIMRKLWDNYYIPYVNGYYGSFEKYSSDDLKTGKVIAYLGCTGEIGYLPDRVTTDANKSYRIETTMLPSPNFRKTKPSAPLKGAGMAVLKSDEVQEKAAVEFLRWMTKSSNNLDFAINAGYLPITKLQSDGNGLEERLAQIDEENISKEMKMSLPLAAKQVSEYEMYTNKAFNNSSAVKSVLASSLINRANVDRKKVIALMDGGKSRKQAVSEVVTDSNFEQWVVRFKMEVKGVVR